MIYLDNAATTKLRLEVLDAMMPYLKEEYGNPSAVYELATTAKRAVDESRRVIAEAIGALPQEIYFTSGGTESDNWALKSVADGYANFGRHIIVSQIEHHAVLNSAEMLERHGFNVTYLDVDRFGRVDTGKLMGAIGTETILVSIMAANNEIGTIEPIKQIGEICRENDVIFHVDAVQAFGHIPLNVKGMHINLLSGSAHKFGGPKGIGFLYVRKDIKIPSLIDGGSQERRLRAGTLNVPGIVGMAKAAELSINEMERQSMHQCELRDYFIGRVLSEIPDSMLNGHPTERLPNNINISFKGVDGETLLLLLNQKGICCSAGSACTSGDAGISHVLRAIGLTEGEAESSLRFSLSSDTTKQDLDFVIQTLKKAVSCVRPHMILQ